MPERIVTAKPLPPALIVWNDEADIVEATFGGLSVATLEKWSRQPDGPTLYRRKPKPGKGPPRRKAHWWDVAEVLAWLRSMSTSSNDFLADSEDVEEEK
jgi:hypothetical protein